MGILSKSLIIVLVVLALNAAAYGTHFILSPLEGLGEYRYDTSAPLDPAAIHLVSLVGIGMLGFMVFAILAIVLLLKKNRNGLSITLALGASYLGFGLYWIINQNMVDASIYGGFGVLITLLALLQWNKMPADKASAE